MASFDACELESWEQGVATLAGSLVHEVKNPLSTLNINTELLLEEWHNPQTPRESRTTRRLQVMRSEIGRIEQIINSFLSFTRQETMDRSRGDLNFMLTDLIESNAEGLERKKIRVRFQPGAGLGELEFDENLLRQAFLNLLRNAEQAMPEGGELIVRSWAVAGGVEVEFTDTGCGIPEERLAKIFRPYFSSKKDGSGLGLPTTLRIVRGHRGNLRVESELGKGSRFIAFLPHPSPAKEST